MKNTNHCPKCNSEDIIRVKDNLKATGLAATYPPVRHFSGSPGNSLHMR